MPKRAKTPTIEDDAKYLTVVRPYPAHPNMELEDHRREFARWIASCTGAFYLRAFYHKPTSPGSVIIEIDETFPEFKRLLGAHKWSEFLVEPNDEAHFVSKIFYCTWNSDRDVQKNGWKRVDVQDKWFKSKAPSKFVSPYPTTHWCEVPRERNVIHNPLCRPLPRSDFPPPPPEPVPVVGTPEWQAWKERQKTRVVTARTRAVLPSTQTAPPVTSAPSVASTPPISRAASSSGSSIVEPLPRQAWRNATTPVLPPGLLPGITRGNSSSGSSQPSATGSSAWGEPAASNGSKSPLPPPSSAGTSSGDDALPETPRDAGPEQSSMVAGSHVEGAFAALSVDDYEDDMYYSVDGEGAIANRETDVPAGTIDVLYLPRADALIVNNAPGGSGTGKLPANSNDDNDNDNDSDNDDEEEEEAKDPGMIGDKKVCPEHNVVCRKGICRVYAAMLREERREEERQTREKERAEAQAKREKAQKKKGKNSFFKPMPSLGPNSPTGSYGGGRAPPPHLLAGAPAPSPTIRAPPPHLMAGAPPHAPSASSGLKPMPAHLQRGASASTNPISPVTLMDGRITPTPSRHGEGSVAGSEESGWGNISEGPWGAYANPRGRGKNRQAPGGTTNAAPVAPAPQQAWGAWGRAPSISASSVRRNNDSWSVSARSAADPAADNQPAAAVSARQTATAGGGKAAKGKKGEYGAWGKAPSVSASSVRRNHDSWSLSARSVAGGGDDDARSVAASDDANWGRPPSVVGVAGRSWADQMDDEDAENAVAAAAPDDDVRSVAGSTTSGWGSISAGPW